MPSNIRKGSDMSKSLSVVDDVAEHTQRLLRYAFKEKRIDLIPVIKGGKSDD